MTDGEEKLLVALVMMINQHLTARGDEVDTLAESTGEHAIEALADFVLMELVNTRFGRWTEAGKRFRREVARIRDRERIDYAGQIRLVGNQSQKIDPKRTECRLLAHERSCTSVVGNPLVEPERTRFAQPEFFAF